MFHEEKDSILYTISIIFREVHGMKKLLVIGMAFLLLFAFSCAEKKGDTLDTIKEQGYITIAVTAGSPPFSFVDENTGEETGFDVDYAKEVAARLGVEPKILMVEWDGILPGLLAGKYDIIIGSMAITEERQKQANFTRPYYSSGAQLIVRADDSSINGVDDLKDKSVGVTIGTTYEEKAKEIPGCIVKTYKTEMDQLLDLKNGNIDAVITDRYIGAYTIKESGLPLKLVGDLIYQEDEGIPVRKEDTKLLEAVDKAVEEITTDGTFEELNKKWFGI
jgi:polar amino acid transport system substrate-binding protein